MSECRDSQECREKAAEYAQRADRAVNLWERDFYIKLAGLWLDVADTREWTETHEPFQRL
jgi:hypothetical protein